MVVLDDATPSVVAVNVAVVAPEATVTLAGTVAAAVFEEESVTTAPDGGAFPSRVTVPVELVPPMTVVTERPSEISDAGFTVDIEPDAGLVARATPPTVEALRRDPAGLGHLGPLIGDLAALAAAEAVVPAPAD